MRKYILTCFIVFTAAIAATQSKPKPGEKPPTQKELADMMKEMQQAMDAMSPEDKKTMDSLGIKMPSTTAIPKLSDQQWADALEESNRIVPQRDAAHIAAVPAAITASKIGAYITAVQNKTAQVLTPEMASMGNEIYNYIKLKSKNTAEAGNMATGFWLAGQPEIALYVLGKLCSTDPANADNISNYSAMLSMQGAQHLAIPMLNLLNTKHPKNSTLLNNLGQAWFGLGDIDKAEQYLDSAIRIAAFHPQANLTKSLIEESKGKKQSAVEAAKRSIKNGYSMEKANRLNKLGYQPKTSDIPWDKPMPQDPLGLEKFKWPDYPASTDESEILEKEWDAFKLQCQAKAEELKSLEKKLELEMLNANDARTKLLLQAGQQGIMVDPLPRLAYKAIAKLSYLVVDKDGHTSFAYQSKMKEVTTAVEETAKFEDILNQNIKSLDEKYEDDFGEGKSNPFDAACADYNAVNSKFLSSSNAPVRNAYNDFLGFMRRKINNEMYYNQYTMWPENFELTKVQAKLQWLALIQSQNPKFRDRNAWCPKKDANRKAYKLSEFDDIACKYSTTVDLKIIAFYNNCSHFSTTYSLGSVKYTERELGSKYTGGTLILSPQISAGAPAGPLTVEAFAGANINIELDENKEVKDWKGTVKAGIETGVGATSGPVKLGASVTSAVEIELDGSGIQDVTIVNAIEAKAGIKAPKSDGNTAVDKNINTAADAVNKGIGALETSAKIGVENRVSLISGHGSVSGTGVLKGVKLSGW